MIGEMVLQHAEKLFPEFVRDLEALVNIDSGSRDVEGLREIADYLVPRLVGLGCTVEKQWHDEYGPFLVARKKGKGRAKVLFVAHLDTVFDRGTSQRRPFAIRGDHAHGPGVNDCCTGVLSQYYAVRILDDLGFEDYGELILVFNSDEELGSPWSGQKITELAKTADVALILEGPTFPDEFIVSRAGTMNYKLDVAGRPIHSGVAPELGKNAISELVYKLNKIQAMDELEGVNVNMAVVSGGEKQGIVAGSASAEIDFRVKDWAAVDAVEQALGQIMRECRVKGTKTTITGGVGHPPFQQHPAADMFIDLVKKCGNSLGLSLTEKYCGGASDSSYTALGGVVTIDGLQPWGELFHTPEEYVDLTTVVPRVSLVTSIALEISRDARFLRSNYDK